MPEIMRKRDQEEEEDKEEVVVMKRTMMVLKMTTRAVSDYESDAGMPKKWFWNN